LGAVSAFFILVVSGLLTGARVLWGPPQPNEYDIQFFATLLNVLSILWLAFVLGRNEKATHEEFGQAVRREIATVVLAISISAGYSFVALFHMLF
jgi:hypothetical protein